MREVVDTLLRIAELEPPRLPPVVLAGLPDFAAATPLAGMIAPDTDGGVRLIGAARAVSDDRDQLARLADAARSHIDATRHDLASLAVELGRQALPVLPGLLSPHPGDQAGARARLQHLGTTFLLAATERSAGLQDQLDPVADRLELIASATTDQPPPPPGGPPGPTDLPAPPDQAVAESPPEPAPESSTSGQAAVAAALGQVGTPYAWGGTSTNGFDCSGLTQWAWGQAGVELPRLAEEQTVGRQVAADELAPGDLAVWDGHVAMYAGDGQLVEAGDPVQTNPLRTTNMGMTFQGFWRPTG